MGKSFTEYEKLDLPALADELLDTWKKENTFQRSIEERDENKPFVFFEGPPSANGLPGIHHVMARTIKDIFCRYKTLKGFRVDRKAGWDTHGLPVELGVEKELGITKEDIGKKISIEEYNEACKKAVMKYTDVWNDLTEKMGYWVDMDNPYITYKSKYIETVWHLLKDLYDKGLIYKGYTIQPFSPKAGTGLSSHELNQPGCYRDVKDTTVTAQFKVVRNEQSEFLFEDAHGEVFFIAWTTTPWTLPSNTALAVGPKIDYIKVKTFNQYTGKPTTVVLAKDLYGKWFDKEAATEELGEYETGKKKIPHCIVDEFKGEKLADLRYEQLLPYAQPLEGDAFKVIRGDFVTTEDGTGIVHIAPTFGADDARVAKEAGIGGLLVKDADDNLVPLVNKQGKFVKEVTDFAGEYVKAEYLDEEEKSKDYLPVDVRIAIKLKEENKAFRVEKYEHSYPHCWRTDKPILYYPLDSWFVKTTAVKDKLIANNKTINWKPESTGTGRFGNWLENLQDWNLSRSRFWGIPIPIWRTEDGKEALCIGSLEQLKEECDKAVQAGVMPSNPLNDFTPGDLSDENYESFDPHRPYVDEITLVSKSGKPMKRETDLIDVWFDSGSMPYAQWHWPYSSKGKSKSNLQGKFPADFIAEGVDQTRGWFFTLHAIATMCFDSVAYKNVVSNGLVLDKKGQKMSKRLGNAIDPFMTLKKYGPDATRWYMITNAQPWDNLKFDLEGIAEVQRKYFRALHNTYSFFALYANVDGFSYEEDEIPIDQRPEIDRWILSRLNSLVKEVDTSYNDYEPTRAGRLIQDFVVDELSNWYVRLCRRRFWKGDYTEDKIAAYQTLYTCLETIALLSAPIAPFYSDRLFRDLNTISNKNQADSVHLALMPEVDTGIIDSDLEERMQLARQITSLVLSLRKKEQIKVRQPLMKLMLPSLGKKFEQQVKEVESLILKEVNVKELVFLSETDTTLVKTIKPDFKKLGPRFGKDMKLVAQEVQKFEQQDIVKLEQQNQTALTLANGEQVSITADDVEISFKDIPGLLVASDGKVTVALDITLSEELKNEGIARELVNRIQNLRKEKGFDVTDKINLTFEKNNSIEKAVNDNLNYICSETLATELLWEENIDNKEVNEVEIDEQLSTKLAIEKKN